VGFHSLVCGEVSFIRGVEPGRVAPPRVPRRYWVSLRVRRRARRGRMQKRKRRVKAMRREARETETAMPIMAPVEREEEEEKEEGGVVEVEVEEVWEGLVGLEFEIEVTKIVCGALGSDAIDCVNGVEVVGWEDEAASRVLKRIEVAVILESVPVCATNEIAVSTVVDAAAVAG